MVLGVTGGIAAGKSLVTKVFRELGVAVISADQLSREAVRPGSPILARLREKFGEKVISPDGSLDRKALAGIVFADPEARRQLNAITHPAVAELAERRITELRRRGAGLIVYEAPLLFEAGGAQRVDAVVVVTAEDSQRLQRLMDRDGIDEAAARARMEAQMSQAEKVRRADFVIDNSGSPEATREQVSLLFKRLQNRHGAPGAGENRE